VNRGSRTESCSIAAGGDLSNARAVSRNAYAQLALAARFDTDEALLDVMRHALNTIPPRAWLPGDVLRRAAARLAAVISAHRIAVGHRDSQMSTAKEEAERRFYCRFYGPVFMPAHRQLQS
jgi:hypothetical protein